MAIDALIAQARERWSTFVVEPAAFARWVSDRIPDSEVHAARGADLYLACACVAGDGAAIAAFEAAYGESIAAILRRYRRASHAADELGQRVRIRLLVRDGDRPAALHQYGGRGELASFVRVVASRIALMYLRDELESPGGTDELDAQLADQGDLALDHLKQTYRAEFRAALVLALGRLEARQRTLLRYQLCDELTIDQVGAIYRVHRATAARWLAQARAQLIRGVHEELATRLAVTPRELEEVLYLVQSRLDVTIERLLRSRPG